MTEDPATTRPPTDRRFGLTADQALARMQALQELSLALSATRTAAEVSGAIAGNAMRATRADGAIVWYLDGRHRTVPGAASGRLAGVELPVPDLAAFARPESADVHEVRPWLDEELASRLRGDDRATVRSAALFAGGTVVGALALVRGPHAAAEDDPGLLGAIVRPSGEALGRARRDAESLQLAALVESSDDAVMGVDPDLRFRTWNAAAERIFGLRASEIIGRHAMSLSPGGVPDPNVVDAFQRVLAGGPAQRTETDHRRPDGTRIVAALTLSAIRDARGTLVGIAGVARDITAQREAELRLRRLGAVVDSSPDAVIMFSPDGVMVDCNPAAERLYGRPREELVGQSVERVAMIADARTRARIRERVLAGERVELEPGVRRLADGQTLQLQATGFPVLDREGNVTAAVFLVRDVTERHALAEALRRSQRLEALGRLAGGIAHDFNNMLTVIDGFAAIAATSMPPGPGMDALEEVRSAASRGQQLTRRLLAFARSQSAEPTSLLVHEVVQALLPALHNLTGEDVRVVLDAVEVPPVRADRAQLEQTIVNLVVNARDAMRAGGDVTITIRPDRVSRAVTDGPPVGEHVRIDVADTGEGMGPDTLERIFEPFFTTKGSETRGSGTGLGLASVHGSVAQAGGHIAVESAPGRGTRFTIRLPVDEAPAFAHELAPAPARDEPEPETGRERILVCEDEPQVLALVRRILEGAGYDVTGTTDPAEALELAVQAPEPFDLLVSDVLMPGMSGPDLAERLQQERPGTPVMFMSGYAAESFDGSDWLERSVLLSKPFARDALLEAVRAQLDAPPAGG